MLQWGPGQLTGEIGGVGVSPEAGNVLQWGPGQLTGEMISVEAIWNESFLLQWGPGQLTGEMLAENLREGGPVSRFNGAPVN